MTLCRGPRHRPARQAGLVVWMGVDEDDRRHRRRRLRRMYALASESCRARWWWSWLDAGNVGGRAFVVEGAVGSAQGDGAVRFEGQRPAAFVDVVMVPLAHRQQIVEVRGAEVFPPRDVMDPAVLEPDLTSREPHRPGTSPATPGAARRVASRRVRPMFNGTPSSSRVIGVMVASQPSRRTVSTGSGWPSPVSHTVLLMGTVTHRAGDR